MYLYLHLFDCEITDTINKSSLNEINKYFRLVHDEIKIYGIVHDIWFDYVEEVVCQYTYVHILS